MSPVATLVKRSTRFLMLVALPGCNHKGEAVADALSVAVTTLPDQLAKSLRGDHETPTAPASGEEEALLLVRCGGAA